MTQNLCRISEETDSVRLIVHLVKEYVNYVSMTEYGLDCQSRLSKSCVVNDGSLSTESSDWIPKYKQLSYSVYVWRSKKNVLNNGTDGRVQGQGHVHPCPFLTRFASSVNTAAQSYAAGFASQQPCQSGPVYSSCVEF